MKKVIEASASYPNATRSQPNLLTLFFLITKLIIINTDVFEKHVVSIGSQIEYLALEQPVASYIGHYNQSNFLIIRCMSAARYNIMRWGVIHY